jgi:hypothetical protein
MSKNNSVLSLGGFICFCFFAFISSVMVLFADACPAILRKQGVYFGITFSIASYLIILCSVFFHLATTLRDQTYQIQYMTIAASGQCIACINNLLIFSFRNLYNAVFHPEALVTCKYIINK